MLQSVLAMCFSQLEGKRISKVIIYHLVYNLQMRCFIHKNRWCLSQLLRDRQYRERRQVVLQAFHALQNVKYLILKTSKANRFLDSTSHEAISRSQFFSITFLFSADSAETSVCVVLRSILRRKILGR